MSRVAKIAGIATGVVAGAVGTAYGIERAVIARGRKRREPDGPAELTLKFDESWTLPSHDGGTINVVARGAGPTIVLIHGITLSLRSWVLQLESLPELGFRVVAFDHRGHGESLAGESGHSLENLAADVASVLEQLDLRDVLLVGHSMGGVAVEAFALLQPDVAHERVRGLVLLSTLARAPMMGSERMRKLAGMLSRQGPGVGVFMHPPNLGFLLARLGYGRDPLPSHVEMNRQMILECDPQTVQLALAALFELDLVDEIAAIDLPTLVITGSADLIAPPAESRRIAQRIPGARLETLKGGGHMLMLERADELNALLVEFAREVGTGSRGRRHAGDAGAVSPARVAEDGR
ncbi:MAG: putative hydrolase or acyltransferase of alpha/beta superfamily [Actinomycetia bacterium]|nr:putative hydrolase or acyltransferase of alpha/beta superfamily [Actinomycetes bacterium]